MVSIWKYGPDMLGKNVWEMTDVVSWAEYERMVKSVLGEGTTWKANFVY